MNKELWLPIELYNIIFNCKYIKDTTIRLVCKYWKELIHNLRDPSKNENQLIRRCIEKNNINYVRYLLQDSRINPYKWGSRWLVIPCNRGYYEIAELLLHDSRLNPSECSHAFYQAYYNGHYNIVNLFLQHKNFVLGDSWKLYIEWSSYYGRIQMIELLLNYKTFDSKDSIDIIYRILLGIDNFIQSYRKIKTKENKKCRNIYSKRINILIYMMKNIKPNVNFQLYDYVVKICKSKIIEEWLIGDISTNSLEHNKSLFLVAITGCYVNLLESLLSFSKENPFCFYKGKEVYLSVIHSQPDMAKYLLFHEKRIYFDDNFDTEAFILACQYGYFELVQLLVIKRNINPSIQNNKAIRHACKYGRRDIVEFLLKDSRVDPSCDNNECINLACLFNRDKVVELLLTDERVNIYDRNYLALYNVFDNNNYKVAKLLLNHKRLDPQIFGCYALMKCNFEITELILSDKRIQISMEDNDKIISHSINNYIIKKIKLLLKDSRISIPKDYKLLIQEKINKLKEANENNYYINILQEIKEFFELHIKKSRF